LFLFFSYFSNEKYNPKKDHEERANPYIAIINRTFKEEGFAVGRGVSSAS